MDEAARIQISDILKQIQDLKQSLQAAGIGDINKLMGALRRVVVNEFVMRDVNEILKQEE